MDNSNEVGVEIARIFGLEIDRLKKFTICVEANKLIEINAVYYSDIKEADLLKEIVKNYKLFDNGVLENKS